MIFSKTRGELSFLPVLMLSDVPLLLDAAVPSRQDPEERCDVARRQTDQQGAQSGEEPPPDFSVAHRVVRQVPTVKHDLQHG